MNVFVNVLILVFVNGTLVKFYFVQENAMGDPPNTAKAMSTHAHSNKLRKEDFHMSEKSKVIFLFLLTNNSESSSVPSCPQSFSLNRLSQCRKYRRCHQGPMK